MGAGHRSAKQLPPGEPVRRRNDVSAVGPTPECQIRFRQEAEIDPQPVPDQEIGGVRAEAIAARIVEYRGGAEKALDARVQLRELSVLDMARQIARKRIALGQLFLEGRVGPWLQMYADLAHPALRHA